MIRRFTNKACQGMLFLLFSMVFAGSVIAQTPIYTEDFSGGDVPAGWVNEDLSGGDATWTWCNDPAQSIGDGCVVNWATYANQHDGLYLSTSGSNGFLVMDSDAIGGVAANHEATITTTAYDFSGDAEVWVKFESLIGVFGLPTLDNALLRVSTDQSTWTDFNFVDIALGAAGNPGVERWTDNPEVSVIDVSAVAAGESEVYFQFFWRGNYEYYWLLDDIEMFNEDPSALFFPLNDVQVNTFFSIAPNAQTPQGQEVPISFLADVENGGLNTATGVNLTVTINDGSTDVFSESLAYADIMPDSTDENQPFAMTYTPSGPAGTMYTGTYSISTDSLDEDAENDVQTFTFMTSDSTFAKETGATRGVLPADSNWDDGEAHSWGFGNYFSTPNGAGQFARYVTFGINNAAEVTGQIIFLKLYQWIDADGDTFAQASERTELANTLYEVTGAEVANELMTMKFADLTGEHVDIPLIDGGRYIVAMEFIAPDATVTLDMASSDDFDYSAQIFQDTDIDGEEFPYMGTMIIVNDPISSEAYDPGGFGNNIVPCLRMSIGSEGLSSAKDLLSNVEVNLTPNPATTYVQLNVNLDELAKDMNVTILNTDGKVMKRIALGSIQQIAETIDVNDLAAGSYYLHLSNDKVSATRRFIVVK